MIRKLTALLLFHLTLGPAVVWSQQPPPPPSIRPPVPPFGRSPMNDEMFLRGNPQRGQKIYETLGCPACHTLDGSGNRLGPDLGRRGKFKTKPERLQNYLRDPNSIYPHSPKPPYHLSQRDMDDLIRFLVDLKRLRLEPPSRK